MRIFFSSIVLLVVSSTSCHTGVCHTIGTGTDVICLHGSSPIRSRGGVWARVVAGASAVQNFVHA